MLEFRTRALVLRTFDLAESDRLVHLYTEDLGRVSAIAKGARRSQRRFPGALEIFNLLDAQLVDPPHASMMRLEGAHLERPFERLVNHLGRYAIACYFVEILGRFTGEHEANPELFRFAVGVLDVLAEEVPDRLLALLVLTKTLAHLGYRPQLIACAICGAPISAAAGRVEFSARQGGAVCPSCGTGEDAGVPAALLRALEEGIRRPLRERARLALAPPAVRRAELLLERFFSYHVGIELRSSAFVHATLGFEQVDVSRPGEDTAPAADPARDAIVARGSEAARRI